MLDEIVVVIQREADPELRIAEQVHCEQAAGSQPQHDPLVAAGGFAKDTGIRKGARPEV